MSEIIVLICFLLNVQSLVFAQYGRCKMTDKPVGFCTLDGGTSGGEGGRIVRVYSFDSLKKHMDSNEKLIIEVNGTIDLGGSMTALRSDKTLIGLGNDARIVNGGLELYKRNNIIIRNITFVNAPDDLLKVNQNTTHLWVDHCTFTDGDTPDPDGEKHDGLFDITRRSNYITISYCLFLNHSKSILIGHSDGNTDDVGYLKTTLHHNWFNGTRQRHPRVRFGEVHCFNNYYLNNDFYGIASTCEADVVAENNYFQNVPFPMYVGYAESPDGDIVERGNIFNNSGTPETRGTAFDPKKYYSYTLDPAEQVPDILKANAGAGGSTEFVNYSEKPFFHVDSEVNMPDFFSYNRGYSSPVSLLRGVNINIVDVNGRRIAKFCRVKKSSSERNSASVLIFDPVDGIYFALIRSSNRHGVRRISYVK